MAVGASASVIAITDQRHARALILPALDADVTMQPLVPSAWAGPLDAPLGLCIHASRYVMIADSGNGRVAVFDAASNAWSAFDAGGTFASPRAVVPDGDGGLLIADTERVVWVADETGNGLVEVFPPLDGRVPIAVCARGGNEIDVATADGTLHRTADGGATWTAITLTGPKAVKPIALATGPTGPTFVCDLANGRVLAVAADNSVSTVVDGTHGVLLPSAMAVSEDDLYVADAASNRVRRFALDHDDVEPAEYVNGRRADGTFRFDQIGGLAEGTFS